MPEQSPLHSARRDLERLRRSVESMQTAPSPEVYEDAWVTFLDAAYRIPNRIQNAGKKTLDAAERNRFDPWFGMVKAQRKSNPFLRYVFHARGAEAHSIQTATERQPGTLTFRPTGPIRVRFETNPDGSKKPVTSGPPLKYDFTPGKVIMKAVVNYGVEYEPPDDQPPHIHAEAAFPVFEKWIEEAEAKFFPA